MKKKYRLDLIIIGVVLVIGLVIAAVLLLTKKEGKTVKVSSMGKLVYSVPLNEDGEYEIKGAEGTNILVVKNGKAHMEDASCPDKICIGMGEIDNAYQAIICLPNEIVVEIQDPEIADKNQKKTDAPDVVAGGKQ